MRALALLVALGSSAFAADGNCVLASKAWSADVTLSGSDGVPLARLRAGSRGPRATLALGAVAGVALAGDGLELRAQVAPGPWLLPRRPLRFGATVIIGQGAHLTLRDPATLEVEAEAPADYQPAGPLRAKVACDDLSLDWSQLRGVRAATGLKAKQRTVQLRAGVDIPVSAAPAAGTEGTLRFSESPDVELVKQEKGWSQVVVDRYTALVYGWIPSGFVQKPPPDEGVLGGVMGGVGGLGLMGTGTRAVTRRCSHDLRLFVRRGGVARRDELGLARAGTTFTAGAADAMWTVVAFPQVFWLEVSRPNELVVSTTELSSCDASALDR